MTRATLSGRPRHSIHNIRRISRGRVIHPTTHLLQKGTKTLGRPPALTSEQAAELATLRALAKLVQTHCSLKALMTRYAISMTSIRTYSLGQHVTFKPDIGTIAAALEVHFFRKGKYPRLVAIARAHNS